MSIFGLWSSLTLLPQTSVGLQSPHRVPVLEYVLDNLHDVIVLVADIHEEILLKCSEYSSIAFFSQLLGDLQQCAITVLRVVAA